MIVPADNTALERRADPIRQVGQHIAMINVLSGGLYEAGTLPTCLLNKPHSHLLPGIAYYQLSAAMIRELFPPQVGRHFVSHPSQANECDVVGSVSWDGPGSGSASQRM